MIRIRMPHSQQEIDEASRLVERVYKDKGYVEKLRSGPNTMFIAKDDADDRIVGTVGVILSNNEPLPTEWYYDFQVAELPLIPKGKRVETIEIGRLCSHGTHNLHVLTGMVVAVCLYTKRCGYKQAIACMKPKLRSRLIRLNVPLYDISRQVVPQRVEPEYRGYFLSKPEPVAVYFKTSDISRYGYVDELARISIDAGISIELDSHGALREPLVAPNFPEVVVTP